MNRPTVFFLGAGASNDDGFPLTRHLIAGVAHYLAHPVHATDMESVYDLECVRAYLSTVYRVQPDHLRQASEGWAQFTGHVPRADWEIPASLPDLTEVLSGLDILINEEWALGKYQGYFPYQNDHGGGPEQPSPPANPRMYSRSMDARELRTIRRAFNRALAYSFTALDRTRIGDAARQQDLTVTRFARLLRPGDTLITSNWDILLDRALHARYNGTTEDDYGTELSLAPETLRRPSGAGRPPLLKLHGSVNWLQCRRCLTLWVDPKECIATGEYSPADAVPKWARDCPTCHFGLTTLMVTPTYLKQYRTFHLAQIWARALSRLRSSDNWVFIGYSLPADDIHIRTMLLRAYRMRQEDSHATDVHVVSRCRNKAESQKLRAWYDKLLPVKTVSTRGFQEYVRSVLETARAVSQPVIQPRDARGAGNAPPRAAL